MLRAFIRDVWRYRDVAANKSRLFSGKLMLLYRGLELNVGLQKSVGSYRILVDVPTVITYKSCICLQILRD